MLLSVGPAVLFVLFIILSGYFLIYNVFYISVSSDIRWFGMMKTIGTTARQLKTVLMQQIRRLAVIGILIGIVLGYIVGNLIGPGVMAQTMYAMFYKAPNVLAIFILGSWIFLVYRIYQRIEVSEAGLPHLSGRGGQICPLKREKSVYHSFLCVKRNDLSGFL